LIVKKYNFIPFVPPVMISEKSMRAMGYLEHGGEDETYHFKEDDLYFVGTSEQSMGPYHLDEILDESKLPLRYTAFSTCFRREAGAAGKDTRGILRTHQFDKIEMFVFCKPEDSDKEHEMILKIEEELMNGLKLPYQVVRLCSGDLGKPSARTYDIETWMPSQNKYRETHSSSNCTDYQARRLNVRFKDKNHDQNSTDSK
ncbi:MAG: serine--tRNA ligase, partial [Patescibacteria group bacterium]|nr:serine--tRNA ligase [Patescibacteria group bacterium]